MPARSKDSPAPTATSPPCYPAGWSAPSTRNSSPFYDIAVLSGFSAELAEAATGNPDAATWIRDLVERNVLIVPLNRERTWLRFHALFREFLLAETRHGGDGVTARRRDVATRAASWLSERGEYAPALGGLLLPLRHRDELRRKYAERRGTAFVPRFERGNAKVLQELARKLPFLVPEFRISIVQPGLSRVDAGTGQLELLAVTETYL